MHIIHIWRALFQNATNTNPKIEFAMPMPGSENMFWKWALHKYAHIYARMHMWKALFQNTIYELLLALRAHLLELDTKQLVGHSGRSIKPIILYILPAQLTHTCPMLLTALMLHCDLIIMSSCLFPSLIASTDDARRRQRPPFPEYHFRLQQEYHPNV